MAGQCASDAGNNDGAIEAWRRALALGETLPAGALRATSAADIARLLANALVARGESTRADALHRQAFRIERGVEPSGVERAAAE
jgi:hypothetical protein